MKVFSWDQLDRADLVVDACYEGGRRGNAGDDPLRRLVGVSNQGGFRYLGNLERPKLIVLTSSLADPDWPDELDPESGVLTYFGDNKRPGRELHDTPRFGNRLLRDVFDAAHMGTEARQQAPPILVFSNAGSWRDFIFRGLAVPGAVGLSSMEDLVALWRVKSGQRFQNYRAKFTILDTAVVKRQWVEEIRAGRPAGEHAPGPWVAWYSRGEISALKARPSIEIRSRDEQLPQEPSKRQMLERIHSAFSDDPFAFEAFASKILRLHLGGVSQVDLTRPYRDGGRDAVGTFRVGNGASSIDVEFAMEAKCYSPANSVGVQHLSRLISRLRHRQFGVIVTTSYLHNQAYKEIREDRHPVVVIAGRDLVDILIQNGVTTPEALESWLWGAKRERHG